MTSEGGGGGLSLTVSSDSISGTNIILIGGGHQEEQEDSRDISRLIKSLFFSDLKYFCAGKLYSQVKPGRNKQQD